MYCEREKIHEKLQITRRNIPVSILIELLDGCEVVFGGDFIAKMIKSRLRFDIDYFNSDDNGKVTVAFEIDTRSYVVQARKCGGAGYVKFPHYDDEVEFCTIFYPIEQLEITSGIWHKLREKREGVQNSLADNIRNTEWNMNTCQTCDTNELSINDGQHRLNAVFDHVHGIPTMTSLSGTIQLGPGKVHIIPGAVMSSGEIQLHGELKPGDTIYDTNGNPIGVFIGD